MGWLLIKRPAGHYRDAVRSYRIEVDGRRCGKVRAGGQLRLTVPAGKHSVRARIDWSGSETCVVQLEEGATVELTAEPADSALGGLGQLFGATSWVKLSLSG
ncbi:hypothetical protein [Kineococcus esterisolvens]|uniref:hypothetical protein n=1 Tax=unclassified Kineococcus TaxID=2621656 RepID=UPI003D7E0627